MKTIILTVLAIVGLAGATTAFAGDEGLYFFGAFGKPTSSGNKSTFDNALTSTGGSGFSSSLSNHTVYNLDLGYQINSNFAVEGGYLASTSEDYSAYGGNLARPVTASANVSGWTLATVGVLPLDKQFSLFGKLGVAEIRYSATVVTSGVSASANGTKTALNYGVGAKFDANDSVFIRFDLDSYDVGNSTSASRATVWTLGVGYKF